MTVGVFLRSLGMSDFVNEISKNYEIVDFSVKSISVDEILAKLYTELDL